MDRATFDRLFDMSDRTVIVTGGTRGIGLALAQGFVLAGARVVVASRKPDACVQASAHLRGLGGHAIGVPTHLVKRLATPGRDGRSRASAVFGRRQLHDRHSGHRGRWDSSLKRATAPPVDARIWLVRGIADTVSAAHGLLRHSVTPTVIIRSCLTATRLISSSAA